MCVMESIRRSPFSTSSRERDSFRVDSKRFFTNTVTDKDESFPYFFDLIFKKRLESLGRVRIEVYVGFRIPGRTDRSSVCTTHLMAQYFDH